MAEQHDKWSPEERRRLAAKITSVVPDNGKLHYGMGMPGTLCGVHGERRETVKRELVTCGTCIGILRSRP